MSRKILCIADDTHESKNAILFAAKRAQLNGSELLILRIVEPPENSLIATIGDAIIDDLRLEALDKLQSVCKLAREFSGVEPKLIIREGFVAEQVSQLIDEDGDIKTLFLAASPAKSNPGPLINAATRGALFMGQRQIAIMIVPSGLEVGDIAALAG